MQPTKTSAIKAFLEHSTHADLAELYHHNMECQVNVAQDDGRRIGGEFKGVKWSGFTDDLTTWKSFRIPRNAMDEPVYTDEPIKFNLAAHAEGIGMTGWDWVNRCSRWVAFDFDAISGHSDKHTTKLTIDELRTVRDAACAIPWVTVRKSTSGQGLHLYVFLDETSTENHTCHSALARAILSHMSAMTGYDFNGKVDICGGNMWVWHRKMKGTPGLQLIKKGDVLRNVPENWRDHVDVIQSKETKVRHHFKKPVPEIDGKFEQLSGQQNIVQLDAEHHKLITWMSETGKNFWWDFDRHMLVTHTHVLAEAHDELKLRGVFKTASSGSSEHNCFGFPLRRGAWAIRRYSLGVTEDSSWDQDGQGWTRCIFNREPNLRTASLSFGGVEDPSGGYVFTFGQEAQQVLVMLGSSLQVPTQFLSRQLTIKPHKDANKLTLETEKRGDDGPVKGWMYKGRKWLTTTEANLPVSETQIDAADYDDVVRHLVDIQNSDAGWVINSDGTWHDEPLQHVKNALQFLGLKAMDVPQILGSNIFKPWRLVKSPFKSEYPGDRTWNRNAPQLQFIPSTVDDPHTPTWKSILEHVGRSLNHELRTMDWAIENGITSGSDYLRCWIASLFQFPLEPLPYLFIYGDKQNTGKSMFHEALSLLFKPGYVRADFALGASQFNGELEGAVLCVVEETDLSKSGTALNKIKDWVTARELSVHRKMKTPYHVANTTKWVQCANSIEFCPIFPGDTRIVVINIDEPPTNVIPKTELVERLKKEAPDFLQDVLTLDLPPTNDRLRIPVVNTADKLMAADSNKKLIQIFLEEECYYAPGEAVLLSAFYDRFRAWLDPTERMLWHSKQKVSKNMPSKHPRGRLIGDSNWHYGNLSFVKPLEEKPKLVCIGDKLIPEDKL